MPDRQKYMRDVMIEIVALQQEGSDVPDDFRAEGLEGDMRRAALDELIKQTLPKESQDLIAIMGSVGISASQTAQAIAMYSLRYPEGTKR